MSRPRLHNRIMREINAYKDCEPLITYGSNHAMVHFRSGCSTTIPYSSASKISDSSWRNIKARIKAAAEGRHRTHRST